MSLKSQTNGLNISLNIRSTLLEKIKGGSLQPKVWANPFSFCRWNCIGARFMISGVDNVNHPNRKMFLRKFAKKTLEFIIKGTAGFVQGIFVHRWNKITAIKQTPIADSHHSCAFLIREKNNSVVWRRSVQSLRLKLLKGSTRVRCLPYLGCLLRFADAARRHRRV